MMDIKLQAWGFSAFLRKPEPVYARQVRGPDTVPEPANVLRHPTKGHPIGWSVQTAHGVVDAGFGDWLLTDGKGDFWPVRDAIFRARYDSAPAARPSGKEGSPNV